MQVRRFLRPAFAACVLATVHLTGACSASSPGSGKPPAITSVTPDATSFRSAATVTLSGSGFARDDQVSFGPLPAKVLEATSDALHVQVPAAKKPMRVTIEVTAGQNSATSAQPFVFRGMAPEDLHFVDQGALPVTASIFAAGDIDGDGKTDLVAATADHVILLIGDGKLGFKQKADVALTATSLVVASLGGKGETIVAGGATLSLIKLSGGTLTATAVDGAPAIVALATWPLADGADDVYAVTHGDSGYALAKLEPGEKPSLETVFDLGAFQPVSLALADVDGDGAVDALLGGASEGPRLLLGDGHGAFGDAAAGTLPGSVAGAARFADLDVDGRLDIVIAAANGDRAWRNAGSIFADRTNELFGASGARAAFEADVDADAAIDRVGSANGLTILRNDGSGHFFDYTVQAVPDAMRCSTAVFAADLDGDSDPELIVLAPDGADHLLQNWAPAAWDDKPGYGGAAACEAGP